MGWGCAAKLAMDTRGGGARRVGVGSLDGRGGLLLLCFWRSHRVIGESPGFSRRIAENPESLAV